MIIMGDFNAKFGEGREENLGLHGLGIRDTSGIVSYQQPYYQKLMVSVSNKKEMEMEKSRRWKQKPD